MDDGAWFRFVLHTEISHNGEKETKPRFSRLKGPLEIVESKSSTDRTSRFMERKSLFVLLILSLLFCTAAQSADKPEPVRVLILGTYHFGNPGKDLHNMKVDELNAQVGAVISKLEADQKTKSVRETDQDRKAQRSGARHVRRRTLLLAAAFCPQHAGLCFG
jgi:hypothetical protein